VHFLGIEIERCPAPDRRPVELLAVGRGPEPGILAGRRQIFALERLEERGVRGIDDIADDLADLFAVGLVGDLDHGRHDRRLDRDLQHALDLRDRPFGHDPRRRSTRRHAVAQDLGVCFHERRVCVQTSDEPIEPRRRVDALELRQPRKELLWAAHLIDDPQLVQRLVVLLDIQLGDDAENVAGDPFFGREAFGRDRCRLGGRSLHELASPGATFGSRILEPVVVALVTVERGGRRVELENGFPEALREVIDRRKRGLVDARRRPILDLQGWSPVGRDSEAESVRMVDAVRLA
jgi:hypothetical protein